MRKNNIGAFLMDSATKRNYDNKIIELKNTLQEYEAKSERIASRLPPGYFSSRAALAQVMYEYAVILEKNNQFDLATLNYFKAWELTAHAESSQRLNIPAAESIEQNESKSLPTENNNLSTDSFICGLQYLGSIGVSRNLQKAYDNFSNVTPSMESHYAPALLFKELISLYGFADSLTEVNKNFRTIIKNVNCYAPIYYYYGCLSDDLAWNNMAANQSFPPALFKAGCAILSLSNRQYDPDRGKKIIEKAALQLYAPAVEKLAEIKQSNQKSKSPFLANLNMQPVNSSTANLKESGSSVVSPSL